MENLNVSFSNTQYPIQTSSKEDLAELKLPDNETVKNELISKPNENIGESVKETLKAGLKEGKADSTLALLPQTEGCSSLAGKQIPEQNTIGTLAGASIALSAIKLLSKEPILYDWKTIDNKKNEIRKFVNELKNATMTDADAVLKDAKEFLKGMEGKVSKYAFNEVLEVVDDLEGRVYAKKLNEASDQLDQPLSNKSKEILQEAISLVNRLEKKKPEFDPNLKRIDKERRDGLFMIPLVKIYNKIQAYEERIEIAENKIKTQENILKDKETVKEIYKNLGPNSSQAMAASRGEYIKLSRREFQNLTNSFIISPEGKVFAQYHKRGVNAWEDTKIGSGGYKNAYIMEGDLVRGVLKRSDGDIAGAISATTVKEFRDSENLMVGHFLTYESEKTGEKKQVFLTPYMSGGDMRDLNFTPKQAASASLQVSRGMKEMHNNNWAHFDIKPANFFHSLDKDGNIDARLADMDLALDLSKADLSKPFDRGSPIFQSPELWRGQCQGVEGAKQNDVFSMGVSILQIAGFSIFDDEFTPLNQNLSSSITVEDAFKSYMTKEFSNVLLLENKKLQNLMLSDSTLAALITLAVDMLAPAEQRPKADEVVNRLIEIDQKAIGIV